MGLQVKLRWLFGLVRVHFSYPKPGNWVVKLLCFTVYKSGSGTSPGQEKESKPSNELRSKNKKNTKHAKRKKARLNSRHKKHSSQNTEDDFIQYESLSMPSDIDHDNRFASIKLDHDHQTETSPPPQKKSLWHRFLAFLYKWLAFFQQKLSDGTYYLNLLRAEETLEMYHRTKDRLRKVLRSLRPRKLKANIQFGTGSPDTTGLAYGVCSMLYPYFGKYINITPNFEKAMFLGDISLSGWAVGWVIIAGVLRISLDKGIRQFLKKWKREVA
jgi:hypothetical protein